MHVQDEFCPADQIIPSLALNTRLSSNAEPCLLQTEQNCASTLVDRSVKKDVDILDWRCWNARQLRHIAYGHQMNVMVIRKRAYGGEVAPAVIPDCKPRQQLSVHRSDPRRLVGDLFEIVDD